jgi:hypothetical protein
MCASTPATENAMLCPSACIALALLAADTTPPQQPAAPVAVAAPAAADTTPSSAPAVVDPGLASPVVVDADADLAALPAALPPTLQPALQPLPALLAPAASGAVGAADTVPQARSVEYSDAYFTRLTIHKYASYATLPLFVAQYVAGEQLMDKGDDAPGWARDAHPALAAGVGALFAVNTVTGGWNLWEGRHDSEGRTRRLLHGGLMLLADAGFVATGVLAEGAGDDGGGRSLHKDVALGSMAVSLLGYAVMLPVFGNR